MWVLVQTMNGRMIEVQKWDMGPAQRLVRVKNRTERRVRRYHPRQREMSANRQTRECLSAGMSAEKAQERAQGTVRQESASVYV